MTDHSGGYPADESPIEAKLAAPPPGGMDVSDDGMDGGDGSPSLDNTGKHKSSKLQSRVAVLSILFLVTGAIGVPLLWVNPNFSRGEQVFWTIVVCLYTLTLLAVFGGIMWWLYRRLIDLGAI
ncbi:hypothetical protein [Planctomycetes bacterium K23_9]|uniref:Uncharacterized protein n=1 Tax=Stieleria marina TaxID=1930275 RepID=A0A517P2U0_9BACT|nr:hypothetical protein K239x_57100 [Planctomycetes bacterium K23_9]